MEGGNRDNTCWSLLYTIIESDWFDILLTLDNICSYAFLFIKHTPFNFLMCYYKNELEFAALRAVGGSRSGWGKEGCGGIFRLVRDAPILYILNLIADYVFKFPYPMFKI